MTIDERLTRLMIAPLLVAVTVLFWTTFRHGPLGTAVSLYLTGVVGPGLVTFQLLRTVQLPERKRGLLYSPLLLGLATAGIATSLM
jgi:hypothetical protein